MRRLAVAIAAACLLMQLGCASQHHSHATTRPMTMSERQDAAMRDPFSYKAMDGTDTVSGGNVFDYDNNAMRKDLDHVLNP